jgi:hypothetical protein
MQNLSKIIKLLAVIGIIVVVGIAIGWIVTKGTSPNVGPVTPPKPGPITETPLSNPTNPQPAPNIVRPGSVPTNGQPGTVAQNPAAPVPANLLTNWEDKLDDILGSDSDDTNKVKELFQMFPRLPEDGQVEIAQHLSNLVEDEDYAPLGKLLENAKLSEDVLDILMADVLNRPNSVKLPMFLELAKNPDHAKAEEAKDLLELYLDEDYGTDWNKWHDKIADWLKENPD